MNETTKTIAFAVVACAAIAVLSLFTWTSRSWDPVQEASDMIGKKLFPDFDPLEITSLEIVKYDEDTGTANRFEVAQVNNMYSIPSHSNYPADAKDQLAEAADSVMGREVLSMESDKPGDHVLYGVLDPGSKNLKAGAVGVGTRVVMKSKDKTLLAMVIGKKTGDQSELHYVRRLGQDPVYAMKVSTDKLSTKFGDWIEKDLLKLSSWDIKQIRIRDYSVDEARGSLLQRAEMLLGYDDSGDPKWKMTEDMAFEQGKWVGVTMAEDDELDADKLNDLKNALDDLKIVDVRRKPPGFSADLTAEKDFSQGDEAVVSLMSKGFYVAHVEDRVELVSNEGEIRCAMKDGVEYILRFGNIAEDTAGGGEEKKAGDADADTDTGGAGLNRYIFVMAEFNPEIIPKPEMEPLPEEEKKEGKEEEKPVEDDATEDAATEKEPDEKDDVAAERERIEKENKRKQEAYDEKIADGKKKVKELNARFADWYYVISDEVYQKIHLGRDQIVKKKEKEEEGKEEGEEKEESTEAESDSGPEESKAAGGPLQELNKLKQEGPAGAE